jgi:cytochrome c biogenesis protein CcdA/thiol-disulfide isomerase/thioredoxin
VLLLAYLGGVLTIVSPCILPVLPFVFARSDRPFVSNGLPMLAGIAAAFSVVGTLAAVVGGWATEANRFGRDGALVLLALFGLTLLIPALADRLTRPFVAVGNRLASSTGEHGGARRSIISSTLLGVATGLLWAPCAGPILGLILGAAALQGASTRTSLLLFTYALGAATSLGLALLAGRRMFVLMKRSLHAAEWVRRAVGVAVLAAVAVIGLGLDTGPLSRVSLASTTRMEQFLINHVGAAPTSGHAMSMMSGAPAMRGAMMSAGAGAMMHARSVAGSEALAVEDITPSLSGAGPWFNSRPLTLQALRGKVVLIDFWTYSCINCLRALPYVRAWASRYASAGLVVIGVHTPEFAFEKSVSNVRSAVKKLQIDYPVVMDNDYAIWRAFGNQFWPAHYFIDAEGRVRHHHFGEAGYEESEQVIRQLLAEAGHQTSAAPVRVDATGISAAPDTIDVLSPETYVGYDRAENFVSPGGAVKDAVHTYSDGDPRLNEWGLSGEWSIGPEKATLDRANGGLVFRFHARDLHLVLGPGAAGRRVRFRVTLDGAAPGPDHGIDDNAQGDGVIDGQRLFQLIRQQGAVRDRRFEIRFLDPGVQVYSFTFG